MKLAAFAASFLLALSAYADSKQDAFNLLDVDGDGAVSLAEAAGNEDLVKRFDRADRDRDGKLSRAEYGALDKAMKRAAKASAKASAGGTKPPK